MQTQMKICIIEKDHFILQDMRDTLLTAFPSAQCLAFDRMRDAKETILHSKDAHLVILSACRDDDQGSRIDELDWLRGEKVLMIDRKEIHNHSDWARLSKPFTAPQLISAAQHLLLSNAPPRG